MRRLFFLPVLIFLVGCREPVPDPQILEMKYQQGRVLAETIHRAMCQLWEERAPAGYCSHSPAPKTLSEAIEATEERLGMLCEPPPDKTAKKLCKAFRKALKNTKGGL